MIQQRICALTQLAKVDGSFAATEKSLIMRIGKSHGMSEEDIENILFSSEEDIDWQSFGVDEKFDLLYDAILVMKVQYISNTGIQYVYWNIHTLKITTKHLFHPQI